MKPVMERYIPEDNNPRCKNLRVMEFSLIHFVFTPHSTVCLQTVRPNSSKHILVYVFILTKLSVAVYKIR